MVLIARNDVYGVRMPCFVDRSTSSFKGPFLPSFWAGQVELIDDLTDPPWPTVFFNERMAFVAALFDIVVHRKSYSVYN